jgi:serine/threonine-protein kinase
MHPPERIDRYELLGQLATGGMATVYLGRQHGPFGFSRVVAIKSVHPQLATDESFRTMFLDEARLTAKIRHANVISTLDVVRTTDRVLLVMEYVEGVSLSALLSAAERDGKTLAPAVAVTIVSDALHGLHAAHELTDEDGRPLCVVHRDVSPQNVLVGVDGVARILDFGVAKAVTQRYVTQVNEIKGKPPYMAPEQVCGEPLDRRADIYSAGVVLWEALVGRRLFGADSDGACIKKILEGLVSPPSLVAKDPIPAALDHAVMKALAKDVARRWDAAAEMADALGRALAPAPRSEVAALVKELAGDELASRAQRLRSVTDVEEPEARVVADILTAQASTARLVQPPRGGVLRPGNDGAPPTPERVGRYEILLPIASGGMATVYLARTQGFGGFEQQIALKLTHPHLLESGRLVGALLAEAKVAARIRHRNVIAVLDVGESPSGVFLVMEYVEGGTLATLRRRGSDADGGLPTSVVARILVDMLAGLHAAHELLDEAGQPLGLVHRDVSPQNLLIGLDGVVRLTDFGIAKATARMGNTQSGLIKGKVAYMAPEQARGRPLDRRCDVWAAGVVAWELFAGRRLYDDLEDVAVILKLVSERPPRLRDVVPGISPQIDAAVARALTIDLDGRTPTALAFSRELTAACRGDGGIAEADEVAELVTRAVGTKISERRRRVAQIMALRAEAGYLVAQAAAEGSSPSLDAPRAPATTPSQELHDMRVQPPAADGPTLTDTTLSASTAIMAHRRIASSLRTMGLSILAGVALGLALLLAWRVTRHPDAVPKPLDSVATQGPPSSPEAAAPADVSEVAGSASHLAPPVEPSATINVHANAPLKSVRVNGRSVPIDRPRRDVAVPLRDDERDVAVRIVAVTSDGRQAAAARQPGASELRIEFPPAAARPSTSRSAATHAAPGPLAPDPYTQ